MPDPKHPELMETPPADCKPRPTACQFCIVGCGYEAHLWQPGQGSPDPPDIKQAHWVSPAMTDMVRLDGQPFRAAVVPDPKCVMNKGNHSPRGGSEGRTLVFSAENPANEHAATTERITTPYIRTANGFEPVSMDRACALLASLVKEATGWAIQDGVVRCTTPSGLGVKMYEYQYLENTFAATRLFFQIIGTPNVALHDRPSIAPNTLGFDDSGMDPHAYAYEDIWESDVLFLAGVNAYEAQSVFFMQAMTGKLIIVLDPRRTITADYAQKTGGLHLQPKVLGADTLILNALTRFIRDRQTADPANWPSRVPTSLIVTTDELERARREARNVPLEEGPEKRRRARYQLSLEEYLRFLDTPGPDGRPLYSLERAASESGIPLEKLERCAQLLAGPVESLVPPAERKVSLIFEKGLIWGFSYQNTAAMANLGLFLGSVLRPAPQDEANSEGINKIGVCGRAGGHQKGYAEVRYPPDQKNRGYPFHNASDEFVSDDGKTHFRTHHYFDAHLVGTRVAPIHPPARTQSPDPDIRLFWVIGCNPVGQMANAQAKWSEVARRRGADFPATVLEAEDRLCARIRSGGLVVVQQDIYPNPTTNYADLILPAAGWGEEDFTRYNGERRLHLYSRFMDPPGHRVNGRLETDSTGKIITRCLPDWRIFKEVALELVPAGASINGLKRSDLEAWTADPQGRWTGTAAVFHDMAKNSNRKVMLGDLEQGATPEGHKRLRDLDTPTNGFLIPVKLQQDGTLKQFPRLPVTKPFKFSDKTPYGYYAFVKADWTEIEADFRANLPRDGEFVIVNGRINELWNSMFTHIRNETVRQRYPDDLPGTILEMHPDDAARLQVRNGDPVEARCDQIHFGAAQGSFRAIVSIQPDSCLPGMVFALFSYPAMNRRLTEFPFRDFHTGAYVNNITTGYVDPINPIAAVKYARGRIVRLGSRYQPSEPHLGPNFAPRNVAFLRRMVADESHRLEWKVREFIVQKGVPRAVKHPFGAEGAEGNKVLDLILDPDRFIELLKAQPNLRKEFNKGIGFMAGPDDMLTGQPGEGEFDPWTKKEVDLVRKWLGTFPQGNQP